MKLFRNKKVLFISLVLIINTLIIGVFFTVHAILEQRVTYEMFSDTEKAGVYKIETIEDYLKFADTVSKGNTYKNCEIVLMNDLDFQNVEEVPVIGLAKNTETIFSGVFDGNGHIIYVMNIKNPSGNAAMFASVDGMVLNLTLSDSRFEGSLCGGIAAELKSNGVILNCYAQAECNGKLGGALAGTCRGYLFNCVGAGDCLTADGSVGIMENCFLAKDGVYQAVSETEQVHVFDLHQNPNDQCIVGKHIRPVLTDVFRTIEEKAEQELKNTTLRNCMDRMQDEIERSGNQ
jgi:hypothetical protein